MNPGPPFRGLARIDLDGAEAAVATPIWARVVIKRMPTRRWSPARRAWLIPATDVDMMRRQLEAAGYRVRVVDPSNPERRPPPHWHALLREKRRP